MELKSLSSPAIFSPRELSMVAAKFLHKMPSLFRDTNRYTVI